MIPASRSRALARALLASSNSRHLSTTHPSTAITSVLIANRGEIALRVGRYSTAAHSAALRGGTGSALERSCRSMLICASIFFQAFHPIRPVIFWGFLLLPSPHAASINRNPLCTVPGASLLSLASLISAQWSTCQAATTAVRCFLLRFPGFGRRGERVRRKSPDLTCYSPLHRLA